MGDTIRDLCPSSSELALTETQQARWDRLVEHGRFDCAGMWGVCLRATRELEAAEMRQHAVGP